MPSYQILVLKNGVLGINGGDIRVNQDREIFIINKKAKPDEVVGHFSVKIPDKFDLWGGDGVSRKIVTEMLKKGKEIASVKKRK